MEWEKRPSAPSTPTSMSSQSTSSGNPRWDKLPTLQQISPSPSVSALSKLTDEDLWRKGTEDLTRILRRVEGDYKSLLGEHGHIIKDVNRRFQIFVLETRSLKEVNQKLQDDNQELRDLCCFLDDDRQRGRKLAREWQRFGRYTASVMRSEVAVYQEKLRELESRQSELVTENMELKELCLYLDQERVRDEGDGSSNGTVTGQEDGIISTETGASNTPTASVSGHIPASSSTNYVRELELKVHALEEEKKLLAQRVERNSAEGLDVLHPPLASAAPNLHNKQNWHDRRSPAPSKPEAVEHAMKVLQVHEELEQVPVAEEEKWDDSEKAIVREMCNVVWRKLGDAGEIGTLNESADDILDPPQMNLSPGKADITMASMGLTSGQGKVHSHSVSQPQPQVASTPLTTPPHSSDPNPQTPEPYPKQSSQQPPHPSNWQQSWKTHPKGSAPDTQFSRSDEHRIDPGDVKDGPGKSPYPRPHPPQQQSPLYPPNHPRSQQQVASHHPSAPGLRQHSAPSLPTGHRQQSPPAFSPAPQHPSTSNLSPFPHQQQPSSGNPAYNPSGPSQPLSLRQRGPTPERSVSPGNVKPSDPSAVFSNQAQRPSSRGPHSQNMGQGPQPFVRQAPQYSSSHGPHLQHAPTDRGPQHPSGPSSQYTSGQSSQYTSGQSSQYASGQSSQYASGQGSQYASGQGSQYASGQGSQYASGQGSQYTSGQGSQYTPGQVPQNARGPTASNLPLRLLDAPGVHSHGRADERGGSYPPYRPASWQLEQQAAARDNPHPDQSAAPSRRPLSRGQDPYDRRDSSPVKEVDRALNQGRGGHDLDANPPRPSQNYPQPSSNQNQQWRGSSAPPTSENPTMPQSARASFRAYPPQRTSLPPQSLQWPSTMGGNTGRANQGGRRPLPEQEWRQTYLDESDSL